MQSKQNWERSQEPRYQSKHKHSKGTYPRDDPIPLRNHPQSPGMHPGIGIKAINHRPGLRTMAKTKRGGSLYIIHHKQEAQRTPRYASDKNANTIIREGLSRGSINGYFFELGRSSYLMCVGVFGDVAHADKSLEVAIFELWIKSSFLCLGIQIVYLIKYIWLNEELGWFHVCYYCM